MTKNTDNHQQLNDILDHASVSKTVYALVMPETEAVVDMVIDGQSEGQSEGQNNDTKAQGRQNYHSIFREAWTQKQDTVHEFFFKTWKSWTAPILEFDDAALSFHYPVNGASEALRETIYAYGVKARELDFSPTIHMFEGEYEGFSAYAEAAGIRVKYHKRSLWKQAIPHIGPYDQFYISQPSAIDGMVWDDFENFTAQLNTQQPNADLMLDLTYVGCVAKQFEINATSPNIAAIFFSLSKPAGAYYHRIGGLLSRDEYPGLFGNKWFKNLTSLSIGTKFMQTHGVYELPRKYRPVQQSVTDDVNAALGLSLKPADVYLLAGSVPSQKPSALEKYLTRGCAGEEIVRVCLTPRMAHMIDPKLNPHVQARYHETLKPQQP